MRSQCVVANEYSLEVAQERVARAVMVHRLEQVPETLKAFPLPHNCNHGGRRGLAEEDLCSGQQRAGWLGRQ